MSKHLLPNSIYCGDARKLLRKIEPNSISCSIWSPPYHVGKSYEKDVRYEEWLDLLRQLPPTEVGGMSSELTNLSA